MDGALPFILNPEGLFSLIATGLFIPCTIVALMALFAPAALAMGSLSLGPEGQGACVVLHDFESEQEIEEQIVWQCRNWFERDRRHATKGGFSLRVELYPPQRYAGITLSTVLDSWEGWRWLRADFFNPSGQPIPLTLRIDDRKDCPPYADRVNHSFVLRPGMNRFELDLASVRTSGTKRPLRLDSVCHFLFFTVEPSQPVIFFMDNVRLCK
jgi:hypothetical protein